MTIDVRWEQRFQNFDRAFVLLRSALQDKELTEFTQLEQEGLIQRSYLPALAQLHAFFVERMRP